jgi:hypothetical protein
MSIDLDELLHEHEQFLHSSCEAFDHGFDGEAKRMAVSVRVLVHDTSKSHSLFSQLGLKTRDFYSTSSPWTVTNVLAHHGLLTVRWCGERANYVANLDDVPPPFIRWVAFDEWWNETVFDDRKGNQLGRRDVVLGLANKEGGAHVDQNLNLAYEAISRKSQFWVVESRSGTISLDGKIERVAMRQIAHEALRTIKEHANA